MTRDAEFEPFVPLCAGSSAAWIVFLLAVVLCVGTEARAQSSADEYHVKAAFLFHFAQFVEWPSNEGGDSLMVCTLGEDPFNGELERTISGKQIGSQVVRIRHFNSKRDIGACKVLFISKGEGRRTTALIASLRNAPILTVGETDEFLETGGMIRFCMEGKKIRFDINRIASESAKLKVSAQLLLLARVVLGGNGGK